MERDGYHNLTRREFLKTTGAITIGVIFNSSKSYSQVNENQKKEEESTIFFEQYHHPFIEGRIIPAIPYLYLPFKKEDLKKITAAHNSNLYDITEGWTYSQQESAIHGFHNHFGVDFAVPYGTPLVAPTNGFAISSYHTFGLKNNDGSIKTYENRSVGFGLGYFIQIYSPEVNRFVQLGHLSEIDKAIPFSLPIQQGDNWLPTNHDLKINELTHHPKATKVEKGQPLGKVGFSGLRWGYIEYYAGMEKPIVPDPEKFNSWDEPHMHYEECYRNQEDGRKFAQRDPYGIYSNYYDYPTPIREGKQPKEPLFFVDDHNSPQFA